MDSPRVAEFVNRGGSLFRDLCRILNTAAPRRNWEALGEKLGYSRDELREFATDKQSSPAVALLDDWKDKEEALCSALIVAFQQLDQFEGKRKLSEWLDSRSPTSPPKIAPSTTTTTPPNNHNNLNDNKNNSTALSNNDEQIITPSPPPSTPRHVLVQYANRDYSCEIGEDLTTVDDLKAKIRSEITQLQPENDFEIIWMDLRYKKVEE